MWKETWRRWAASGECTPAASSRIAAALETWLPETSTVTAYHPLGGEPVLDRLIDGRRRWLAPRVKGDVMTFHDWDAETETVAFGLRQPTSAAPVVSESDIDSMVIPGLAFDRRGVRLGRGGGFYDRFLEAHPELETVGVIPVARLVEALPQEPHDRRVRWLVTDAGILDCRSV